MAERSSRDNGLVEAHGQSHIQNHETSLSRPSLWPSPATQFRPRFDVLEGFSTMNEPDAGGHQQIVAMLAGRRTAAVAVAGGDVPCEPTVEARDNREVKIHAILAA